MVVLSYVKPAKFVLLAAILFAFAFAIVIGLCTHAKTPEVVLMTAAYASVLMVFVGIAIQGHT